MESILRYSPLYFSEIQTVTMIVVFSVLSLIAGIDSLLGLYNVFGCLDIAVSSTRGSTSIYVVEHGHVLVVIFYYICSFATISREGVIPFLGRADLNAFILVPLSELVRFLLLCT